MRCTEDAVIHEEDGTVGFTAETGVGDGEHVSTNGGVEAGVEAEAQALAGMERGSGDDIGVTGAERRDDTDVVIADVGARSSVGPSDMDVDESSSSPEWLSEKFVDLKASSHSSVDEDGSTVSTVSSLEDSSEGQSVGATNGRRKVSGAAVVRLKTTMGREECDDEGLPASCSESYARVYDCADRGGGRAFDRPGKTVLACARVRGARTRSGSVRHQRRRRTFLCARVACDTCSLRDCGCDVSEDCERCSTFDRVARTPGTCTPRVRKSGQDRDAALDAGIAVLS